ncbi:MAG TPA: VWA domain-containing protein [Thermoanaerobaculia bacterium]
MRKNAVAVLGITLAILATAVCATAAQNPPSNPPQTATAPYVETFDVEIHNIDVVVTDRAGKPVSGLTKEDFEVFEDRVLQPITNFSEYRNERGVMSAASDTSSPAADNSPVDAQSRKFVFVIDEMALHPQTREKMREELGTFLRTMMRNGDEAMIVQPDAKDTQIRLRFTNDESAVLAALDEIIEESRMRADSARMREYIEGNVDLDMEGIDTVRRGVNQAYSLRIARRVQKTLAHLSSIVNAMAEVPGKKSIIMMTESLPAVAGRDLFPLAFGGFESGDCSGFRPDCGVVDLRPIIRDIAEEASSNGITIYAMQPEYSFGISAPGPSADARPRLASQQNLRTQRYFSRTVEDTQESLEILTERTGGAWKRGHAHVDNLLAIVEADHAAYYSIGYRPASAVENKTRHISVKVKGRNDLRVRTRRDVIRKSPAEEMNDLVVASLMYPKEVDELSIEATAGEPEAKRGREYLVPVEVQIPISSLTLLPDGQKYRGSFTVHYAAATEQGDFSAGVSREQIVEIPASDIDAARTRAWTHTAQLRVPKGKVSIAVGVLDPISRLSSFKTLDVVTQ